MARWYKCFATKDEQKAWESEQKNANENFRVCMRMKPKQLEKELYMPKGSLEKYDFATIYTTDE